MEQRQPGIEQNEVLSVSEKFKAWYKDLLENNLPRNPEGKLITTLTPHQTADVASITRQMVTDWANQQDRELKYAQRGMAVEWLATQALLERSADPAFDGLYGMHKEVDPALTYDGGSDFTFDMRVHRVGTQRVELDFASTQASYDRKVAKNSNGIVPVLINEKLMQDDMLQGYIEEGKGHDLREALAHALLSRVALEIPKHNSALARRSGDPDFSRWAQTVKNALMPARS